MKGKGWLIAIGIIVLLLLFGSCQEESERNKVGSSIDWGDGYYWDSSEERVKETIW